MSCVNPREVVRKQTKAAAVVTRFRPAFELRRSEGSSQCAWLENRRARQRGGVSLVANVTPSGASLFGKENRIDLQTARSKCARATEQIKSPHSPETFAVTICKARPGAAEIFLPGKKCRIVIRADVLDVVNDENAFRSARQTGEGRKHGIRENVALDPGIAANDRKIVGDSLAKKQSILA